MSAWPNRKETRLEDDEIIYELRSKLGCGMDQLFQLDPTAQSNCQACGNTIPVSAEHMASCAHTRQRRHDEVVRAVADVVQQAGQKPLLEHQLSGQHRIDIFFRDRLTLDSTKQFVMLDVTVVQPYATSGQSDLTSRDTMQRAVNAKNVKYVPMAPSFNARVLPMPFTTLGAHHHTLMPSFLNHMAECARLAAIYFPELDRKLQVVWRENISFALARSTARAAKESAAKHRSFLPA